MSEHPGRHDRSFGGLLGAMVVTVVVVAGYIGFRAFIRDQPEIQPDVDYAACAAFLQEADVPVVYPSSLPAGWRATSVNFEQGAPPTWRLSLLTDDEEFVGVVQQQEDVEDLLDEYVDEGASKGEDAQPANTLGVATWQTWSDSGGDHAFSTELAEGPLAGRTLLVYGSAPVPDQEELLGLLTLDQVSDASNDCDTDQLS